ncbi:ABC transporter substrate-binding protein [Vibrio apostichopi]|uniref:ABC transporter substrate-binding protein n=1 Tax=Vibrio apostichopi TaxID=3035453 RepID=UPI0025739CB5|nr:ABC transporter substrate-binding protein [Vibrio sp. FE10]
MTETCLRRLNQLLSHYEHSILYDVNLDDLENVFATSRRNTSNILKILGDCNWILWKPGIGRGKNSTIQITVSMYQAIYQTLSRELVSSNFDAIAKILCTHQEIAANALNHAMLEANRNKEKSHSLVISQYPWVDELNPTLTYRFSELQVTRSLYDTLLIVNKQGKLEAQLAYDYKVEGKHIYLWIRPEVTCHDGLPLTINDVIYSLKVLKNTRGPVNLLFQQVEDIYFSESEGAVCMLLESENPLFLYCLAIANASIITSRNISFSKKKAIPIGTGPFSLSCWDQDKIILRKNPHYFSKSALLQEITLSHQESKIEHLVRYNHPDLETENHLIQAFSYVAYNMRNNSDISPSIIQNLFKYLKSIRNQYSVSENLHPMTLNESSSCSINPISTPILNGNLVFAHPKWTIKYLENISNWIIQKISETGISVEVVILSNASAPEMIRDKADLLFVEEVVEQPLEYGLYEWMLTSTAIRFIYPYEQLLTHASNLHQRLVAKEQQQQLIKMFDQLCTEDVLLPLFWGKEEVVQAKQVNGLYIDKSGYSDFYKLWIKS